MKKKLVPEILSLGFLIGASPAIADDCEEGAGATFHPEWEAATLVLAEDMSRLYTRTCPSMDQRQSASYGLNGDSVGIVATIRVDGREWHKVWWQESGHQGWVEAAWVE